MKSDGFGALQFRSGLKGEVGELPGFRLKTWPTDGLKNLSQPEHGFGLDLTDVRLTDAQVKELADFKQIQALNLNGTRATDAGVKELRLALPKITINR